jgi:hypothetical protein
VALAFFEQELYHIHIQLEGLRKPDPIGRRTARYGLPDTQCGSLADRRDLSDRRLAIEHGNRLASADRTKVLTESRFELGDSHLPHDYIMTISSHLRKTG